MESGILNHNFGLRIFFSPDDGKQNRQPAEGKTCYQGEDSSVESSRNQVEKGGLTRSVGPDQTGDQTGLDL